MAVYTMTMQEVLEIPNFVLFDPDIPILGYESLQERIIEEYFLQEINYETPDYFRLKLNHSLKLRADNYNKMLKAQLIEIDPFITEYIESCGSEKTSTHKAQLGKVKDNTHVDNTLLNNKDTSGLETYSATGNIDSKKDGVGTNLIGKLLSESENRNTTSNEVTDSNYQKDADTTKDQKDITKKITDSTEDVDTTENTTYSETKEGDIDIVTNTKTDKLTNINQTDRKWTETGDSQAHNLSVRSDTPQAMLFNEPNHYYGTGRAHDYGEVVTDAQGNQSYAHYPEFEPSSIDTGSYKIGGGDTPWYNYASDADNKSGHDSYNKSGTETYARNQNENENKDGTSNETNTTETDGNKDITGTAKTDFNETVDTTNDTHITENLKETGNTHENSDKSVLDSLAKNAQENVKEDNSNSEIENKKQTEVYDKNNNINTKLSSNNEIKTDKHTLSDLDTKEHGDINTFNTRKGRTMRSPSALLSEYRKTLTFNADMWLLSELRGLFLQVF